MVFVDRVVTSNTKMTKSLDSATTPVQPAKAEQETSPEKAEVKNQTVEAEKPKRGKNKD